ncbi:MAG: SCO family protein [bacterium]|nr:SCO family protein [bacterium]
MLRYALLTFVLIGLLADSTLAREDRMEPAPKVLKSLDVVEHPNAQVPTSMEFVDETGKQVKLGDYLNQGKPVILTLNYLVCPMLCKLTLNGMFETLGNVPLVPGKDYEIVTISFNPSETQQLAKVNKQNYGEKYEVAHTDGWHILTGNDPQIKAITEAVGFSFRWIPERQEYAHPSVLIVLTPDGRVSRYIYGVKFDPQTVKLTLVEASKGKIGTPLDKVLLFCFHYDSASGAYAPMAMNIMRLGGGITLLALIIVVGMFWINENRRRGGGSPSAPLPSAPGVSSV